MQELIKRDNVYHRAAAVVSIRKGKSQQYIKDDREYVKVMVKRASEGLVVRYGEGAAKLEGTNLSRFMNVLDEYLKLFDKVDKRLRDERVTDLLPKLDLSKRVDFEGDKKTAPKKIEKLEKELKKLQKERSFKRSRKPLRRRTQSVGSALRELAGRGTLDQLGAGFHSLSTANCCRNSSRSSLTWSRRLWSRPSPKASAKTSRRIE